MLADLHLQNFRSYSDESFEFSDGVNIIVGPNTSGKTNLIESILVLAKGNSYRAKDGELIKFNKPWARIDAILRSGSLRTVKLQLDSIPNKAYDIDGKTYRRLTTNHKLPLVLFEPNHLQLLNGGPDKRRDYLDDIIEQISPDYSRTRKAYKRALAQRNSLLKHPSQVKHTQIFPWNVRLSQLAGTIIRERVKLVNRINDSLPEIYKKLSKSKTEIRLVYESKWNLEVYETKLLKELETNTENDKLRGFTSVGPHREDVQITFNGVKAQDCASRGEIRTAILALKIIELKIIEDITNIKPLLLLDDVFSELDGKRRQALTKYISNYQTFITTTDADSVIDHFVEVGHIIPLSTNKI